MGWQWREQVKTGLVVKWQKQELSSEGTGIREEEKVVRGERMEYLLRG